MAQKERDPRNLSLDDLITWAKDLIDWLAGLLGAVDISPRAGDFPPLATAYEDAYNAALSPKQYAPLLNKELLALVNPLLVILREIQVRIPLLPGVLESELADFALGEPLKPDLDELLAVCDVCKAHWLDISVPAPPVVYTPLVPKMAEMVLAVTAFTDKHAAYRASIGNKEDAIAYRDDKREALLVCEREIFRWYFAAHRKGDDPFWRTTPWGSTPGGTQPGEGEPLGTFPARPQNMKVEKAIPPQTGMLISSNKLNGAATYKICKAKAAVGAPRPVRPIEAWMEDIEDPVAVDEDVMVGMINYYWMCGVDEGGVEGAYTDANMEWIG